MELTSKPNGIVEPWPEEGLEAVAYCPACGDERRSILHEALTDRVHFCAPGHWRLMQCSDCGSAYMDPRPRRDFLHLAYSRYYTHQKPDAAAAPRSFVGWLRRGVGNGYRNVRYGTRLAPASRLCGIALGLLPSARIRIDMEFRYLPRRLGRVLDFGCGNGRFLANARDAGWVPSGIDLDPAAVEVCRSQGLDAHQGGIEALEGLGDACDAVTASHVIEHLPDPAALVDALYRALRPGGHLFLDTPNIESRGHRAFGRDWYELDPPRHLVIFTWPALERLVRNAGFTAVRRHVLRSNLQRNWSCSALIAAGIDPHAVENAPPTRPGLSERLDALLDRRWSEHATLTARKPM